MGNDLSTFARRIDDVALGIPIGAARVQRAAALAADQAVVVATPKDTGRATSNWIASAGAPSEAIKAPYVAGSGASTGEQCNAGAISQAAEAIAAHRPGQPLYIANNLPYIGELDRGTSPQAKPGFVSAAVNAAISALRSGRIRILRG